MGYLPGSSWCIIVPPWEPGGPLRVVANRPPTGRRPWYNPSLCLSAELPAARFRKRDDADRIARHMRRDKGRPIVIEAGAV